MTKRSKLIDRIRARPPEADFDDVLTLLNSYGWVLHRQRGSHITLVKEGERAETVPAVGGRSVKRVYRSQLRDRLGLDDEEDSL